jgi:hypothetical protein
MLRNASAARETVDVKDARKDQPSAQAAAAGHKAWRDHETALNDIGYPQDGRKYSR